MTRGKGLSARAPGRDQEVRNEKSWAPQSLSSFRCVSVPPLAFCCEEQAWRTGEACLLQNPVPIAAVWCRQFLGLGGFAKFKLGLFAKSFVTQHPLSSF